MLRCQIVITIENDYTNSVDWSLLLDVFKNNLFPGFGIFPLKKLFNPNLHDSIFFQNIKLSNWILKYFLRKRNSGFCKKFIIILGLFFYLCAGKYSSSGKKKFWFVVCPSFCGVTSMPADLRLPVWRYWGLVRVSSSAAPASSIMALLHG